MTLWLVVCLLGLFAATCCAAAADIREIPVTVRNVSIDPANAAPVSAGIPFPKGALSDPSALSLVDGAGDPVPLQTQTLAKWPGGSVRWVLLDFAASVPAGSAASFTLSASGADIAPANPVKVDATKKSVKFSNGIITFTIKAGDASGLLKTASGRSKAEIVSRVEIGVGGDLKSSRVVVDALEVYASGPVRAAVNIKGRRLYSDGVEGPFFQRVEMFADSPYIRVEDTFIYAHLPGTHAKPQNPLSLWRVEARKSGAAALDVVSLMPVEEADGLVVTEDGVSFWGGPRPFDLSRHTDEELVGEDTPGMALGLGKSAAALFGLLPKGVSPEESAKPSAGLWAHTSGEVYAASGALGGFAPERPGKFEDVEEGMRQVLGFWMWFQDNDPKGMWGRGPWHGIFDWGDWQTRYTDVHGKPVGWQYYEGRYGWDCGEMDTTLMLWNAFLHSPRPEFWRAAVAMSRHAMDVDVLNVDYRKYHDQLPEYIYDPHSYGAPWQEGRDRLYDINTIGLGRRHNVQHWGNGVGDTRHTWNGGVIMYYYLTGNRRAYDTAINMAEMHMQRIWGYASGEYTVSLWCLYYAWQLTGSQRYLDEFKFRLGVVYKLRKPDGTLPEHLDFDKQTDYPEVNGDRSAWAGMIMDYISNALCEYYNDTRDEMAREMLMALAEREMKSAVRWGETYQPVNHIRVLAWAYEQTRDERFLERLTYYMNTMAAKPLAKWPTTEKEWVDSTYEVMRQQAWRIRHIGPGMRQIPYGLHAMGMAER